MDWNRSKTIFIGVFVILNIVLYVLYLNRYTEAQQVELLSNKMFGLQEENITYGDLPTDIEKMTYMSGKIKAFTGKEVPYRSNQLVNVEKDNKLVVTLFDSIKLQKEESLDVQLTQFVFSNVYEGGSYELANVDEEKRTAIFFQRVKDYTLYHNVSGTIVLHWNERNEISSYEQTYLEKLDYLEREETVMQPIQVIQSLFVKGVLKQNAYIKQLEMGYSTLVQLTQAQVFAPTWKVIVENKDHSTEVFYVNAIDGSLLEVNVGRNNLETEEDRE